MKVDIAQVKYDKEVLERRLRKWLDRELRKLTDFSELRVSEVRISVGDTYSDAGRESDLYHPSTSVWVELRV